MEMNSENRVTFLTDKSAKRKARSKNRLSENTLALQDKYIKEGFYSVAEIAFLLANDSFEDLQDIAEEFGVVSKEYDQAFARTNNAVKTALPYFATPVKNVEAVEEELTPELVEQGIINLLKKAN